MPESRQTDSSYAKGWYGRQLDRLHREAPEDQKTTPEDALRHLPIESLAEVLDLTFQNYETRASGFAERCLVDGEIDTYLAFIKAHHDILERFDLPAPNHYQELASIIAVHFIRKKEKKLGFTKSTVVYERKPQELPVILPAGPLSASPAPPSVSSWINKLEANAFDQPFHYEQDVPDSFVNSPDHSFPEAPRNLEQAMPNPANNTPKNKFSRPPIIRAEANSQAQTTNIIQTQRQRHPRKTKNETPSKPLQQTATKKSGRGRKAANNGPAIAVEIEADTKKQPKGRKRVRVEDAVVSSEDVQVVQKKRKIAKPATKSKR
jgi:hypothetical protein